MEERTKGAWLISHTKKLKDVTNTDQFEDIELAGKCGIFLSNLAASHEQSYLNSEKVKAIASVSGVSKTEIEGVKRKLENLALIDSSSDGSISVIGVTTASVLTHTAHIFNENKPDNFQQAALEVSETISDFPRGDSSLKQYISDTYKLSETETNELFSHSEYIGFVDFEELDDKSKIYFNGNLYRKEGIIKATKILDTLKTEEIEKVTHVDSLLATNGCITLEDAKSILGEKLLAKLHHIGIYDFNELSNSNDSKTLLTKPSAFSKYGNPFEEDALDLAKAFVASLYYGMHYSSSSRGRIMNLRALVNRLLWGEEVGPATAIGQDYLILEYKRVIQIRHESGGKYFMKLLKKDIGELALQVLETGDVTEQAIKEVTVQSGNITNYKGPEITRTISRKKQNNKSKAELAQILRTLRNDG